ncbi:cell cycle protein MesJ [Legionella nautarum]|uniref:tRNA(Ile)-lysidine synthase n=1 Tax=Legionella nautarum TaxID=45070 RepID=A0A0W0WUC2_9GAMM|nr:tRNA lysidine(34) synthetase TilS [Legionella nautarum]KTD35917.1 cell cycle protein MesJ [Legionella nautarum]
MTKSLLDADWLKKLGLYKRIFVGFSGGLDSTVLLHSLATYPSLLNQLTAVHIHHGISPNAFAWQQHCQQFCKEYKIPLLTQQVEFERHANLEEKARQARYQAFANLLTTEDCLLLGHHLNDQAETLLLQLFRGAGIDGLAAMQTIKKFAQGVLLRPFLLYSREILESYARTQQLKWIDDESNLNTDFSRNYLRHKVLPILQQRWPAVVTNLVRTTRHCQQAQTNLDDLAKIDCPALSQSSTMLPLKSLKNLSHARLSNVLRVWLKFNHIKLPSTLIFNRIISEVIEAREDAKPEVVWQEGCVRRYQQALYLLKNEPQGVLQPQNWSSFPQTLVINGLGRLQVKMTNKGLVLPTSAQIEIRFRQGGEFFHWHGQTKQLKKLFQEWHIPPWQRGSIPLLYVNRQLAVVIGYAISDLFYGEIDSNSYQLSMEPI